MKARRILNRKLVLGKVAIQERIWEVPKSVPGCVHGYKHSFALIVDGVCVLRYDNERGKGDHCHLDGIEAPYAFTGVDQLIEDFIAAVAARRAT